MFFWPENINNDYLGEENPDQIISDYLDQAARELSNLTKNKIVGEVSHSYNGENIITCKFYLKSNIVAYRYLLFKIEYTLDGFPITLIHFQSSVSLDSKEAFQTELKRIFRTKETHQTVTNLSLLQLKK